MYIPYLCNTRNPDPKNLHNNRHCIKFFISQNKNKETKEKIRWYFHMKFIKLVNVFIKTDANVKNIAVCIYVNGFTNIAAEVWFILAMS